jgi:hypothetical protein
MTNNPLIEKYNELYNPRPPKPKYNHLRGNDIQLIHRLELLIEEIKTGRASHNDYDVKDNYRRANISPPYMWNEEHPPHIRYDEGQLITIQVFRSYV